MALTLSESARLLRAALKAAGFNARRLSLRQSYGSLLITIRDPWVSISQVQAIAGPYRQVQHCPVTGEILGGGNVYVEVRYDETVLAPARMAILAVLSPAPENEMVEVLEGFHAVKVSRQKGATYPEEVRIIGPGFPDNATVCGVAFAAKRIAIAYFDACAQEITSASALT
jgi:hypothetical protein